MDCSCYKFYRFFFLSTGKSKNRQKASQRNSTRRVTVEHLGHRNVNMYAFRNGFLQDTGRKYSWCRVVNYRCSEESRKQDTLRLAASEVFFCSVGRTRVKFAAESGAGACALAAVRARMAQHGTVQHGAARCNTSPPGGANALQGPRRLGLAAAIVFGSGRPTTGSNSRNKAVPVPALGPLASALAMAPPGGARSMRAERGGGYAAGCRDRMEPGGWACGCHSFWVGRPNAGSNSRRKAVPVPALVPLACAHAMAPPEACATSARLAAGIGWSPAGSHAEGQMPGPTRGGKQCQCRDVSHLRVQAPRGRWSACTTTSVTSVLF